MRSHVSQLVLAVVLVLCIAGSPASGARPGFLTLPEPRFCDDQRFGWGIDGFTTKVFRHTAASGGDLRALTAEACRDACLSDWACGGWEFISLPHSHYECYLLEPGFDFIHAEDKYWTTTSGTCSPSLPPKSSSDNLN